MLYSVGLFPHVGYSLTERYLFEIHSPVRFRVDSMRSKLTALLNGDSAEQVRVLLTFTHLYYYFLICIFSVLEELQVEKEPWENQSITNGVLWPHNSLPNNVRDSERYSNFLSKLKSHYFNIAFYNHIIC